MDDVHKEDNDLEEYEEGEEDDEGREDEEGGENEEGGEEEDGVEDEEGGEDDEMEDERNLPCLAFSAGEGFAVTQLVQLSPKYGSASQVFAYPACLQLSHARPLGYSSG